MAASSPTPTRCSVCGKLTRRPYYRHIYTERIPYCDIDARCFSYGFTAENAIREAQAIIRAAAKAVTL